MGSAATFYRGVQQQQNEHDLQMKDALRQQQLGQHDAVVKNIQGILASGVDPHTQQPLTDENKAQLNNALKITLDSQKNLYNPNFDPAKGEVPEDPIHKLTDKLHITKAPQQATPTMATAKPKGLVQPGNLNIWNRPTVQNADGSHSSEYSVSFTDENGNNVLVPTVVNGKFLTPDGAKPAPGSPEEKAMFQAAWQHYKQTGEHLGSFDSSENANTYAELLHNRDQSKRPPGQQMQDLQDITAKYAAPVEVNPYLKTARQLKEAGFSDEEIKRKQQLDVGMIPKPNSGTDFDRYLDSVARDTGKTSRLELGPEEITDARRAYANSARTSKETFVPDTASSTGFSKVGYDADGQELYRIKNAVPPRGVMGRETTTTDNFGQTNTTVSKPVFPGAKTTPAKAAPANPPMSEVAPTGVTPTGITPAGKPAVSIKTPAVQKKELSTIAGGNPAGPEYPPLDEDGHIPARAAVNPSLRQAANNILDGMDVEKLNVPARDKAAAQDLAAKYGWKGQGTFTPKEQIMLREASTFIDKMAHSKSLATLDESFFKQLPMVMQSSDPGKEGLTVKFLNKLAARKMTDAQTEFMQNYRQVVGTISGLSQLVRSGKATEAQINRLIAELPNPYNTKNAQDAENRLLRLKQEISVAMQKGRFEDDKAAPAGGDQEIHYHVNEKNQLVPDTQVPR
jgi:hypothetical protein